ncbi:MAG: alpha/beta hydrolase [Aquisalimonadaceae bacterium]
MTIGHKLLGVGREGVIVMHGWFGDHTVFSPMFNALDRDGFTYAFVDCRGYGRSREQKGDYSMKELAQDALSLAEHLGWERFHVLGHSMGGLGIQQLMIDAGNRVRSAVAVTPVPPGGLRLPPEQRSLFEAAVDSDDVRRGIVDFSTGGRLTSAWVNWVVERCAQDTTREAFAGYLGAFLETDLTADAKGLETPLLVAVGQHDAALTPELMENTFLQCYPNARLEVIPNAGHYPMQETPIHLAALIEAFYHDHGL